ncbi:MAG: TRAP transporter large permease [Dehalococcoidia bacterium]|jgi:tripartite ATP-independent transporter DctM subunit|nr:TRAP transporter large permease [Dehalococcoidia bacterium]
MIALSLVILLGLMALTIPVVAVLGIIGLTLDQVYSMVPLVYGLGQVAWKVNTDFILVAIPLYILLGQLLLRSGIAERMYAALSQWFSWMPGGLMHSNIVSCAMFAAVSGSSAATAATIGTVAIAEIDKHEYNERLFLGSLASGGTLGILIPPSINLIVFGVLTNTSIPKLYLAGIMPGLLLTTLFVLIIVAICIVRPSWGGRPVETDWPRRIRLLPDLLPPIILFLLVVGSIYAGLATPTESAALGVVGAMGLAAARKRLSIAIMVEAIEGTLVTTGFIMIIVVAAYFLNFVFSFVGLTSNVNSLITSLDLSPYAILAVVIVFYLVLGMFMETLSMMVATVPIITPVIIAAGFDPVWFGILMILLIETALITPPVGFNLFVIQGVRGRGQVHDVMIGALPFVVALQIVIVLIIVFPQIPLWLPDTFWG